MQKIKDVSNRRSSDTDVSLSPESGSLFHLYHSKLSKVAENSSQSSPTPSTMEKFVFNNGEKFHKPKRNFLPRKHSNSQYFHTVQRMDKFPNLEMTDHISAEEEAERHCTKTFHLKDSHDQSHRLWKLPPSNNLYTHKAWQVSQLMELKNDLNTVKGTLECYDIDAWHKHTHNCNPAHKIAYSVRCKAKPELLTQAFLKFYEILHSFSIIPESVDLLPNEEFRSLHLCEAPGAFIVALNHFLALHHPQLKWWWLGNTLNPHFEGTPSSECIADDRFILHTPHNWFFGSDETGNLMSIDYLEELRKCIGPEGVGLVTADGSIDCQGNPSEQEAMTHSLHLCEVVAALSTLRKGGAFVLKKFTFFESESVNMMFLLSCSFDDVFVHKPITSKAGNSEVYVVAIGYNPSYDEAAYAERFAKFYGKTVSDTTLFSREEIPSSFLSRFIDCCSLFKDLQVDAIQRNIHLYNTESQWSLQYCNLLKTIVLKKYLACNICQPIPSSKKVVSHTLEWDRVIIPENIPTKWGGQIMKRSKPERMKFLKDQFDYLVVYYRSSASVPNGAAFIRQEFTLEDNILKSLLLREGKPFHFVFVSRFCHVNLMQVLVQTFKESTTETEFAEVQRCHVSQFKICDESALKSMMDRKSKAVLKEVSEAYPKATVLDEGYCFSPHSCHKSFEKLLKMLEAGEIKDGSDAVILNCPLFTRLQNGLLTLTSVLFEKVVFHDPVSVEGGFPFFALVSFVSIEKGKSLARMLNTRGCCLREDNVRLKTFNQVLPLQVLISSKLHPPICRYNSLYCLGHVHTLQVVQGDDSP